MKLPLRHLVGPLALAAAAAIAAILPFSDVLLRTLGMGERSAFAQADRMCAPESAATDILFVSCGGFF